MKGNAWSFHIYQWFGTNFVDKLRSQRTKASEFFFVGLGASTSCKSIPPELMYRTIILVVLYASYIWPLPNTQRKNITWVWEQDKEERIWTWARGRNSMGICIMRSFVICTLHRNVLGSLNKGGLPSGLSLTPLRIIKEGAAIVARASAPYVWRGLPHYTCDTRKVSSNFSFTAGRISTATTRDCRAALDATPLATSNINFNLAYKCKILI